MRQPRFASLIASLALTCSALATGCQERLTPERVRELLDDPKGTISHDTMATITKDFFVAGQATAVESFANLMKADALQQDGSSNIAPGASFGVLETAGDVFCVGGLVASAAALDACKLGEECDAELKVDACVLRVGDPGADEDARGNIKFHLKNTVDDNFDRSELGIEFGGWESTREEGRLDSFDGVLALETSLAHDDSHTELVFAADVDANIKRKERGLFDDGIVEHTNLSAGLRFIADQDASNASGSLEVLAFADTDGGRDESVVIRLAAEGHELDAENAIAEATLEVIGENGTFACQWSGSKREIDRDGTTVQSEGSCTDENGETFSFSGEATSN